MYEESKYKLKIFLNKFTMAAKPKVDASEIKISWYNYLCVVNIKVFGGEGGPASTLAPKLGPLGLVLSNL